MTTRPASYPRHRFSAEIISHAVWLYHVFSLSLRDVELILAERGVIVTRESIRHWCRKFGADFARRLRRRRPKPGDTWHLDEVFIRINGVMHYLWRAVDQHGVVLDIFVQDRRNAAAAKRFFKRLLHGLKYKPKAAGLKAGETLLLIGGGGGVGSAAAQVARRLGARVIGAHKHVPPGDAPIHAIAEKLIIGAADLPKAVRAATGGKGADVVFDLVGGVMFRTALNSLALRGRLVEIAATGQRNVSFDLADFYHNESRLFGVDTLKRDLTASAEVLDTLTPGFIAGDYHAAPIAEICGLGEAQAAYRKVAAGAAGRIVLRPQE